MHISITGDLGSGKSTVAKELCNILNHNYLSTGTIQRQLAEEMGMNTLEFNKYTNEHSNIDDFIDQQLKNINHQEEFYVLDSRLAFHFVEKSFKVYLTAADEVAAQRVLQDKIRIGESSVKSLEEMVIALKERRVIENQRFEKTYNIKPDIFSSFDLVVDASTGSVNEVIDLILTQYELFKRHKTIHQIWWSPYRLFPTKEVVDCYKGRVIDLAALDLNVLPPIPVLLFKNDLFCVSDHQALPYLYQVKSPFTPVSVKCAKDENSADYKHLKEIFSLKNLTEWEKIYDFTFIHYPKL
ncbi:MAG: AAA family ATPase [Bacteroidales bacterium]|jgi:cytidylate kinase|nr:AAA family ATPase [Bacteroidales bacterium]